MFNYSYLKKSIFLLIEEFFISNNYSEIYKIIRVSNLGINQKIKLINYLFQNNYIFANYFFNQEKACFQNDLFKMKNFSNELLGIKKFSEFNYHCAYEYNLSNKNVELLNYVIKYLYNIFNRFLYIIFFPKYFHFYFLTINLKSF